MSKRFWIITLLVILGLGGWYYVQHRQAAAGGAANAGAGGRQGGGAGGHRGGGADPNMPVPVVAGKVEEKNVPDLPRRTGHGAGLQHGDRQGARGRATRQGGVHRRPGREGGRPARADRSRGPIRRSLDQAIAKKAQDEAQLANARLVLKRDEDLIDKKVLDQQSYDTQRFMVDQMVATVQADQAAIDNARTQLDYTHITAPLAGRVGVRQVDQGNLIHATDAGGLVVITQLRPISVVFTLPEQNFQMIRDHYPAGRCAKPR